jgi:hypothetical protein
MGQGSGTEDTTSEDVEVEDVDTTGDDTGQDDGTEEASGDSKAKDAKPGDQGKKDREPVIDGDFDADRAKRTIERLRREAADLKGQTKAEREKTEATLKAVQKALGLAEDDKPDPVKLAAQLEEARAAEQARRVEMQVLRLAPKLGGDPDALLDSQAFTAKLKGLDPADPAFAEDVEDLITEAVKKNARYRMSPATETADEGKKTDKKPAGRSGGDMSGAGTRPRQVTEAELASMTPQEIVKAQDEGRLTNLLGS